MTLIGNMCPYQTVPSTAGTNHIWDYAGRHSPLARPTAVPPSLDGKLWFPGPSLDQIIEEPLYIDVNMNEFHDTSISR